MQIAILNGQIGEYDKLDRAWLNFGTFFGDGVYEVIRSYNGKLFAVDEHLERLKGSMEKIGIDGVDISAIKEDILKGFGDSNIANAKIYVQITRGCGERSHGLPDEIQPDCLITITELPDFSEQKKDGVKAITYPDIRWKRCDIKSLNLLANVMATREAEKQGCKEAVFVEENGLITECASAAFFAIIDGKIYTAPLSANILPSITRKYILKACGNVGIEVVEEQISKEQAYQASELFIGVSTRDIAGIIELDGNIISDGKCGPITKKLNNHFKTYV